MKEYKGTAYIALLLTASYLSLYGSLKHSLWAIWAIGIVLAIAIAYTVFPKAWTYIINIGALYFTVYCAVICVTALRNWHQAFIAAFPFFLLCALYVLWKTIKSVVHQRNKAADVQYVSLGLWALCWVAFLAVAAISAISWYMWATNRASKLPYVAAECIIILMVPYLLYVPEKILSLHISETIVATVIENCPHCGAELKVVEKKCPNCNAVRDFYYCSVGEKIFTKCMSCHLLSALGKKCERCGGFLEVFCSNCGHRSSPKDWK